MEDGWLEKEVAAVTEAQLAAAEAGLLATIFCPPITVGFSYTFCPSTGAKRQAYFRYETLEEVITELTRLSKLPSMDSQRRAVQ